MAAPTVLPAGNDEHGFFARLRGARPTALSWGTADGADLRALDVRCDRAGLRLRLSHVGRTVDVAAPHLLGTFNVENVLVAAGLCLGIGLTLDDIARGLATAKPPPGRMQRVPAGPDGPTVVVDYAHTPDALGKGLQSLRPRAAARGGGLWCVFGCGGDRDASKRPLMGAIAARLARRVVVTSDNPRREAPAAIMRDVLAGIDTQQHPHTAVQAVEDRREAILQAVMQAAPADVVLVAGKGHETTQEIGAQRLPFSDVAEAAGALRARQALSQRGVAA